MTGIMAFLCKLPCTAGPLLGHRCKALVSLWAHWTMFCHADSFQDIRLCDKAPGEVIWTEGLAVNPKP